MQYRLRPARRSDLRFIREFHEASMRPHVERQFKIWDADIQRKKFEEAMIFESQEIIEVDGREVGLLNVVREPDAIVLDQLWLLPSYQNMGLGTRIIESLIAESATTQLPIHLQVLLLSPAFVLYKRLGFEIVGKSETHYTMVRSAAA